MDEVKKNTIGLPMLRRAAWIMAIWTAFAGMAQADNAPVVVELYTSQGCSSCPPADALLTKLDKHEDVIALALHIDYWDYIGWKDSFARPEFTQRQKNYAHSMGKRMVYTPQMIVGGTTDVVGNRPMDVADEIQRQRNDAETVTLTAKRAGETLVIEARANTRSGPCDVFVVRYIPHAKVDIKRGENAGMSLVYSNVVTSWTRVAEWDGKEPLMLTVPYVGDQPAVVLIQSAAFGPMLAAARLP